MRSITFFILANFTAATASSFLGGIFNDDLMPSAAAHNQEELDTDATASDGDVEDRSADESADTEVPDDSSEIALTGAAVPKQEEKQGGARGPYVNVDDATEASAAPEDEAMNIASMPDDLSSDPSAGDGSSTEDTEENEQTSSDEPAEKLDNDDYLKIFAASEDELRGPPALTDGPDSRKVPKHAESKRISEDKLRAHKALTDGSDSRKVPKHVETKRISEEKLRAHKVKNQASATQLASDV